LDKLLEKYIVFLPVITTLAVFIIKDSIASVVALGISMAYCLITLALSKIFPVEKPTKLEAQFKELEAKFDLLDKVVQANADYSVKEFGTLKNVLQIKQMGLR
jgi:hypothetical protein